jgi:hypothetical protein
VVDLPCIDELAVLGAPIGVTVVWLKRSIGVYIHVSAIRFVIVSPESLEWTEAGGRRFLSGSLILRTLILSHF